MMTGLPDGWESDYDGTRWFYRYKATGMIQFHFPQPGDEFAEFLLDAGTGPFQLTPEDSLAIEQESRRRSLSNLDNHATSGTKTSGSRRERKKIEAIEEEDGMSATGYFDPSSFMYFPDNPSPVGDDDGEGSIAGNGANGDTRNRASGIGSGLNTSNARPAAAELPASSQQMWSPVGYVAELATEDTLLCAEELAPVELDATSFAPGPIQTNMAQQPTELPTHRTPVEAKEPDLRPSQPATQLATQPATQPVDPYPLVSASFAYPPLNANTNPVSSGATSTANSPTSLGTNPVEPGQNKYQPWKPTQGVVEQQPQAHNKASEILPQTSVLQNQDTDLGSVGRKNSENAESSMSGKIPDALSPPSGPSKPTPTESSNLNLEGSVIPAALQPAHHPTKESVPPQPNNQQFVPETQANHDSNSVSVAGHNLSYAPSVLKPGGRPPSNSLQGSDGNSTPKPQYYSNQYVQESAGSHHPSGQVAPSAHGSKPSIMRIESLPSHLPSGGVSPPKMNGSPGFLFFHEIPNTSSPPNPGTIIRPEESSGPTVVPCPSDPSLVSGSGFGGQIPVVAPLSFVKRHSLKSSEVSSTIAEPQDSNPHADSAPSDEISEVISVINSFTPHGTPVSSSQPPQSLAHAAIGNGKKPSPMATSNGAGGARGFGSASWDVLSTKPNDEPFSGKCGIWTRAISGTDEAASATDSPISSKCEPCWRPPVFCQPATTRTVDGTWSTLQSSDGATTGRGLLGSWPIHVSATTSDTGSTSCTKPRSHLSCFGNPREPIHICTSRHCHHGCRQRNEEMGQENDEESCHEADRRWICWGRCGRVHGSQRCCRRSACYQSLCEYDSSATGSSPDSASAGPWRPKRRTPASAHAHGLSAAAR
ncbi:hypothetical protein F5X97DRAFT_119266 [Nemania serpens]|nr:hypothetical protein F5X97DRAFT_119266 [Nemania serpens]